MGKSGKTLGGEKNTKKQSLNVNKRKIKRANRKQQNFESFNDDEQMAIDPVSGVEEEDGDEEEEDHEMDEDEPSYNSG